MGPGAKAVAISTSHKNVCFLGIPLELSVNPGETKRVTWYWKGRDAQRFPERQQHLLATRGKMELGLKLTATGISPISFRISDSRLSSSEGQYLPLPICVINVLFDLTALLSSVAVVPMRSMRTRETMREPRLARRFRACKSVQLGVKKNGIEMPRV